MWLAPELFDNDHAKLAIKQMKKYLFGKNSIGIKTLACN